VAISFLKVPCGDFVALVFLFLSEYFFRFLGDRMLLALEWEIVSC
jgi:hypothetical protein